jgi:hypothetical protein
MYSEDLRTKMNIKVDRCWRTNYLSGLHQFYKACLLNGISLEKWNKTAETCAVDTGKHVLQTCF